MTGVSPFVCVLLAAAAACVVVDAYWISVESDSALTSLSDLETDGGLKPVKMNVIDCSLKQTPYPSVNDIENQCGARQAGEKCKFDTMFCTCKEKMDNHAVSFFWSCPRSVPPP